MSENGTELLHEVAQSEYKYGFVTDIESDKAPAGLSEETIRFISAKKDEPEWLLEWRLRAFRHFQSLVEEGDGVPEWAHLNIPPIDLQAISYYAAPKKKPEYDSLDEVDPEIIDTFNRLGIPLAEQERLVGIAVDVVMDSVSVTTTFNKELEKNGIIFCSFSEAVHKHPDLVRKYLGSVVPHTDNFFAALNSAVFSDGSFCYIPKGVKCPVELSTYFRINESGTGQLNGH